MDPTETQSDPCPASTALDAVKVDLRRAYLEALSVFVGPLVWNATDNYHFEVLDGIAEDIVNRGIDTGRIVHDVPAGAEPAPQAPPTDGQGSFSDEVEKPAVPEVLKPGDFTYQDAEVAGGAGEEARVVPFQEPTGNELDALPTKRDLKIGTRVA
jgi:hypothetical protein